MSWPGTLDRSDRRREIRLDRSDRRREIRNAVTNCLMSTGIRVSGPGDSEGKLVGQSRHPGQTVCRAYFQSTDGESTLMPRDRLQLLSPSFQAGPVEGFRYYGISDSGSRPAGLEDELVGQSLQRGQVEASAP